MDADTEGGLGAASKGSDPVVKLPFRIMNMFTSAFTHLGQTMTQEFTKQFTLAVKECIQARLQFMTEKELKDV